MILNRNIFFEGTVVYPFDRSVWKKPLKHAFSVFRLFFKAEMFCCGPDTKLHGSDNDFSQSAFCNAITEHVY